MPAQSVNPFDRYLQSLLAVIALFGLIQAGTAAETNAPRPNIVLILADDLGYSDLGCYGSEISTPNLDRLAATGTQLTQFYTTPRCCPTRAALLTGLYPQQAGIGDMMQARDAEGYRGELNKHCPTIAEQLRMAGYRTLMVGKWHVSHIYFDGKRQLNYESDVPFWDNQDNWPLQRGFDEYFGAIHGVTSYYDPFSLVRGNTVIKAEGKDFYYTDAITEEAVAGIEKQARGSKPFFLYVAYTAPHWPLQAPEADIAKYRSTYLAGWDVIRSNRYQKQIQLGIVNKAWPLSPRDQRVQGWETVQDKAWEANRMAAFAAMVDRMDRGVGRIMAKLKETGADQNTLVIFLSDNGACDENIQPAWYDVPSRTRDGRPVKVGNQNHAVFAGSDDVWQSYGPQWANVGDTPFRLYKHFAHEGGIATPFIASWPKGIPARGALNRQVGHVTDIMATCVELAGATRPVTFNDEATLPLEGISLLPILQGKERTTSAPIFWEHEGNRAVRQGQWKLVAPHSGRWELYDAAADRTELNNLAEKQPDKVKELAALYEQWAKRCKVLPLDQLPPVQRTVPARVATTSATPSH